MLGERIRIDPDCCSVSSVNACANCDTLESKAIDWQGIRYGQLTSILALKDCS